MDFEEIGFEAVDLIEVSVVRFCSQTVVYIIMNIFIP
jgi:hypothetical protein